MPDTDAFLPLKPDVFEILLALAAEARHGYGLLKVLEARGIELAASLLYRKLRRLMEEGLVVESRNRRASANEDARRRYYELTGLGEAVVRAEASRIVALARSGPVRALARQTGGEHA